MVAETAKSSIACAELASRHIGSSSEEQSLMLEVLGVATLDDLCNRAIPRSVQFDGHLRLPEALSEAEATLELQSKLSENRLTRTFIGLGYAPAITPPVIQRNILENPGWYTQYTPYQAEIAQGRLEALLNFQTMVASLTGLPIANASLLDEATACVEAMMMCRAINSTSNCFFVDSNCHPQTIDVLLTRAEALSIKLEIGNPQHCDFEKLRPFGVLGQFPGSDGSLIDPRDYIKRAHAVHATVVLATCPLALCLLASPGDLGADIAIGSTQRFGQKLGFGGPHAAFLSSRAEYVRSIPGRIVGISKDASGHTAYRLALQTREQHIRRERALSNICTAQALPAIAASFYAIYHGPSGLRIIADHVARLTSQFARGLMHLGLTPATTEVFDTVRIQLNNDERSQLLLKARDSDIEVNAFAENGVSVTFGESHQFDDVSALLTLFSFIARNSNSSAIGNVDLNGSLIPVHLQRKSAYLQHPVFHRYRTEHELTRYMKRLESRDLSLTTSMIPLGSCTMKLNPTSAMLPMTWSTVTSVHPFSSPHSNKGIRKVADELAAWLAEVTGMDAVSLQPNSGAQGEYAGLLAIQRYHRAQGNHQRNVCLIPTSAHGTNPASAIAAGLRVQVIACDSKGNIDLDDLRDKVSQNRVSLSAVMVTYPSTHGVFEDTIGEICDEVHRAGGQVYLDGANLNAQVGLCRPGDLGADVCHINLHKTFGTPHGGGGPGMGPIAVKSHLRAFLPGHRCFYADNAPRLASIGTGAIAASPYGSASLLPIAWSYIRMMGANGLRQASQVAILHANYLAWRLSKEYTILYWGQGGLTAHEFIIDARPFKKSAAIEVDDIAKRLMDYGYHAPTVSFPVPGTLMIEPTESESLAELDRFCDALLSIREEIREIEMGKASLTDNVLKGAPHTALSVCENEWAHAYSREKAAFPTQSLREHKFWPYVGRVDASFGDRHLVASREPPIAEESRPLGSQ